MAQIQIAHGQEFTVAVPADAPADASIRARLRLPDDTKILRGKLRGYAWEQLELVWLRRKALLLSLANMGPLLRRNQAVMVHDTQVFDQPQSYSKAFRRVYNLLQPRLALRVRYLLTVSEHPNRQMLKHGLDPLGRAIVLPNGVDHFNSIVSDPKALAHFDLDKGHYFLAVGSLALHKNLPFLVHLFQERTDVAVQLVIAGGGNATVFGNVGISESEKIRLLGRVSDGQLRALYEGACGLLFPSLTEGYCLPSLEAMLCGCPVIASYGGAIPEACGEAAILLNPSDAQAWSQAITDLADAVALQEDLSARGRLRAAQFTWARTAHICTEALGLSDCKP